MSTTWVVKLKLRGQNNFEKVGGALCINSEGILLTTSMMVHPRIQIRRNVNEFRKLSHFEVFVKPMSEDNFRIARVMYCDTSRGLAILDARGSQREYFSYIDLDNEPSRVLGGGEDIYGFMHQGGMYFSCNNAGVCFPLPADLDDPSNVTIQSLHDHNNWNYYEDNYLLTCRYRTVGGVVPPNTENLDLLPLFVSIPLVQVQGLSDYSDGGQSGCPMFLRGGQPDGQDGLIGIVFFAMRTYHFILPLSHLRQFWNNYRINMGGGGRGDMGGGGRGDMGGGGRGDMGGGGRKDKGKRKLQDKEQQGYIKERGAGVIKFKEYATVAIACFSAYKQEDSFIMNQSLMDRGFFRSLFFWSFRNEEKKMGTLVTEDFGRPDRANTLGMHHESYDRLDDDGIAPPGTRVSDEDVIIGKTTPISQDDAGQGQATSWYTRRDRSTSLSHSETRMVVHVLLTTNADGLRFVKVSVRSVRIPQIGGKFSSRHGQKGTIGMTPDIIVNPHDIPFQMTIGQLNECIMDNVAAHMGKEGDATLYTDVTVDQSDAYRVCVCGLIAIANLKKNSFECTGCKNKTFNNLPMGYPVLQQHLVPATGQPHLDSMGMSACHMVNGVPATRNYHPMRMNSGNDMVLGNTAADIAPGIPPGSSMSEMAVSPTSVASSGHFPFTASNIPGMGVDTSALDTAFTSDVASSAGLQLGQDNEEGNSRDSLRSLAQIPWSFSLSDLTADLSNLGDLGALGNYPGSPFLPSDSDILLDSPEQDDIEEFLVDSVPGPPTQSDEEKS